MPDINDLINKMASAESEFRETTFVAPVVTGGKVRARVGGLVQTFQPRPADFSGWGVFRPVDSRTAELVEEAPLPLVAEYLRLFKPLRVILATPLPERTWLAYPANEGDMRQRWKTAQPVAVRLVDEGATFETAIVHDVGGTWWFAETDRRADPMPAERLREALREATLPDNVAFPGLTPEMATAYDLAAQYDDDFLHIRSEEAERRWREDQRRWTEARPHRRPGRSDEARLRQALALGGGALDDFTDRGEYWLVTWRTSAGDIHTSAIGKGDLTVVSSGICLSGQDRDFDLQSLVGVIEQREW